MSTLSSDLCPACAMRNAGPSGFCRSCDTGGSSRVRRQAVRQSVRREARRTEDQGTPGHQLRNADRPGLRKAHCSCGTWSPLPLDSPPARRAWHRRHVANPMSTTP